MFEVEEWGDGNNQENNLIHGLFGDVSCSKDMPTREVKKKKRKHRGDTVNSIKLKITNKDAKHHEASSSSTLNGGSFPSRVSDDSSTFLQVNGKRGHSNSPLEQTEGIVVDTALKPKKKKGEDRQLKSRSGQGDEKDMKNTVANGGQSKRNKSDVKAKRKEQKLPPMSEDRCKASTTDMAVSRSPERGSHANHKQQISETNSDSAPRCDGTKQVVESKSSRKLGLQEKMKKKLESSRFRWINEQLYTTTGDDSLRMFSDEPALFDVYHRGFRAQVEHWPVNPVDVIIQWVKQRPSSLVLADFGCGDAVIAQTVSNKVHSFDLVTLNDLVTACNMAKVPLEPSTIDVAIFCLSLMGTDLQDFLKEAYRVLKTGGILKIAEVVSRVDVDAFIRSLNQLGFELNSRDNSNKMFILLDFTKVDQSKKKKKQTEPTDLTGLELKPCIYKRR